MFRFVIARHTEDVSWLFDTLRNFDSWKATIYNDGPTIDVPTELLCRVDVLPGDKVPAEATKYLQFIIDNYDNPNDERLIFLQADPVYHNYTFLEVLKHTDKWNPYYQNLCLNVHSPPWGCSREILEGKAPNITYFSEKAAVWSDKNMDDLFEGEYYKDPGWLKEYNTRTNVSKLCAEWGVKRPASVDKTYCALFSTNWACIKRYPIDTWRKIHDFNIHGNADTRDMTMKLRACILESMWAVLFTV